MENLKAIVAQEVTKYAADGIGHKLRLFPIIDEVRETFTVLTVDNPRSPQYADPDSTGIVIFARLIDSKVIIEADNTDKPLIDALLQRGIPREQIILAYAGEPVPDPVENS